MHLGGVFTWFRSGSLPLSSISIHKHSEGGSTTPRHSTIVVDVSIHYVCNLYVCMYVRMYVCIHERVSAYTLLYAVYNCLNSCLLFVRNKCRYVCITVSCDTGLSTIFRRAEHNPPVKKVQVARTRLPSVGFRRWSRFLAVSLQVTWVINSAVGCQYFLPGPQLPLQPLRRPLPILLLGDRGTMGVNSLPKTVTRLNRQTNINFYTQKLKRVTITKRAYN